MQLHVYCLINVINLQFFLCRFSKPLFYTVYLIIPLVITSLLTVSSFYLPSACCERITLTITILLSTAMLLLMVSTMIPKVNNYDPQSGVSRKKRTHVLKGASCRLLILVMSWELVFYSTKIVIPKVYFTKNTVDSGIISNGKIVLKILYLNRKAHQNSWFLLKTLKDFSKFEVSWISAESLNLNTQLKALKVTKIWKIQTNIFNKN